MSLERWHLSRTYRQALRVAVGTCGEEWSGGGGRAGEQLQVGPEAGTAERDPAAAAHGAQLQPLPPPSPLSPPSLLLANSAGCGSAAPASLPGLFRLRLHSCDVITTSCLPLLTWDLEIIIAPASQGHCKEGRYLPGTF